MRRVSLVVFLVCSASGAYAQTTVTINQSKSQVVYATVRGGSHADSNYPTSLETRSASTPEYERHALLKFDTQNTIPSGASVASAMLTVTVKSGSADATRTIGAYQVSTSWIESEVTWNHRRSGSAWTTAGGDLGTRLTTATAGNSAGAKVTFDVTSLVKAAVKGDLGSSRYTRIALVDEDDPTSDSYRAYHTPDDSDSSTRPVLQVVYGSSTTTSSTSTSTTTATGSTLKVMQWNTHHGGVGTDGKWDPYRLMKKAASLKPDVLSLNEVERYTGWGNCDEPALLTKLMHDYTGQTWYSKFSTATGSSTGNGNLVLSRFPLIATHVELLSYGRSAVDVTISINGRTVNVTSTHIDPDSTSTRLGQIADIKAFESTLAENRIVAGDFNAWPSTTENTTMKQSYYDSWAEAQADGTAVAYAGNIAGNTRNSRIDYIYYSKGASTLVLKGSQVFDVRDSSGVMPSDHRPVMTTFAVR